MEDKNLEVSASKARCRKSKDDFKEKECEIISYNQHTKMLDVKFNIKNVESFYNNGSTIKIKYKGTIGNSDFVVKV